MSDILNEVARYKNRLAVLENEQLRVKENIKNIEDKLVSTYGVDWKQKFEEAKIKLREWNERYSN